MSPAPAIRRVSPPRKRVSRESRQTLEAASMRQTSAPHDPDPRVRGDDSRGSADAADISAEASYPRRKDGARKILVIACGALAREVLALEARTHRRRLPASAIAQPSRAHSRGDAGQDPRQSRGLRRDPLPLRRLRHRRRARPVLAEEGVTRIEGAHCYAFYAGEEAFSRLAEEEPGTFYLTDFLARHFDALVIRGLGLDRFPQLRDDYFGQLPPRRPSGPVRRPRSRGEGKGRGRPARPRLRAPLHRP